ncbi:unnamed protein product [Didymodactylos carnosus]|uniref:Uncharacterized protein n=1 Tax=Didymodactylos carnosus TaxID=1234261 RepID=A0A8S2FCH6_9BILA|nr:unnamed protein product [Didymodactylos carnosus]CAF4224397.1 unnamed protein product [Didymodactylos carnosus]
MMSTIFQVNDVHYSDSENIWIIKLSRCGEDDPRLKDTIDYIKYEIKDTVDLIILADFFIKIGEYYMAKEYYRKYENQLSINNPNMKRVWQGLLNIADIQGNYFISMEGYSKAHVYFSEQFRYMSKFTKSSPTKKKSTEEISNHSTVSKMIELSEDQSEANKILETFIIVWLDANVNKTKDNEETYKALRRSINYLKTFDNMQESEAYVQSIHCEKIILIVSGGFGMEIVPRIHDFEQINSIYVYYDDKSCHEPSSKDYSKGNIHLKNCKIEISDFRRKLIHMNDIVFLLGQISDHQTKPISRADH